MKRSQTIYNWKKRGVVSDDYDKLYDLHMSITNCQICNIQFDDSVKNRRCLDHDHHTGYYRKTLCNSCNSNYKKARQKIKCNNTSGHMWIYNHKSFNKRYNKYYFSWGYSRKNIQVRYFKNKTQAIAYSFIQLLKEPF